MDVCTRLVSHSVDTLKGDRAGCVLLHVGLCAVRTLTDVPEERMRHQPRDALMRIKRIRPGTVSFSTIASFPIGVTARPIASNH